MNNSHIPEETERILKPGQTFYQKVAKSGAWAFILRITDGVLGFARIMILARLLAPNDFGLMGIALLTLSFLETFSHIGFQPALVQRRGDVAAYLDISWTVSVIRGLVLFIMLFLSAPHIALFFDSPEASLVFRVIGASLLLGGFSNIGIIYFQRDLEFDRQFVYQLCGTLTDFVVAVSLAFILKSAWALVFGLLAGNAARLVAGYVIHPYRPHLSYDFGKAKELFVFGKWILGSNILGFLLTQGDDLFVGKFLGIAALGFYQLAYRISNMPATEITHVISQVTFPAYSMLRGNISSIRETYLRVLHLTSFLSFPLAGLIFILAPDFVGLVLGEKWMPMVPAMMALVFWGGIRSVGATQGPIFQALGKPEILTKMLGLSFVLLAIIIFPLTVRWGILGTSLAVVFATSVSTLVSSHMTLRIIDCGILPFCRRVGIPLAIAVGEVSTIALMKKYYYADHIGISELFILAFGGILFCLGMTYLVDRSLGCEIRRITKEILAPESKLPK